MDKEEREALLQKLDNLILEHRDLDMIIDRLSTDPSIDEIQMRRFKKKRLLLKDMIVKIKSKLIPDIEA